VAEYAEVINGKVIRVLVIDDNWAEEKAQELLAKISSNEWVKTYKKVGKEYEYHKETGMFTHKKPFDGWVLDKKREMYIPPIPKPIAIPVGYIVKWSQELRQWILDKVD